MFSSTSDLMLEPGRKEKCPLTRCLSAREARMVRRRVRVRQQEGGQDCVRVGNQTDFTDVPVVPIVTSDPPEPESSNYQALPVYLSAGFLGCLGKF